MKLLKEEFNKLNQLDRIEYRQRRDSIDSFINPLPCFYIYFMFLLFSTFLDLIFRIIVEGVWDIIIYYTSLSVCSIFFIFGVIVFCMNLKRTKELNEEYFKIEPKDKGEK